MLLGSWSSGSKHIWIRSFKLGTIRLSMTIYSKVIGCQSLQSKIVWIAWSLSAKIIICEWGQGSIPGLGKIWRLETLQPFGLQGLIVSHLKDLIHICLEPEDLYLRLYDQSMFVSSSKRYKIYFHLKSTFRHGLLYTWTAQLLRFFESHCAL